MLSSLKTSIKENKQSNGKMIGQKYNVPKSPSCPHCLSIYTNRKGYTQRKSRQIRYQCLCCKSIFTKNTKSRHPGWKIIFLKMKSKTIRFFKLIKKTFTKRGPKRGAKKM